MKLRKFWSVGGGAPPLDPPLVEDLKIDLDDMGTRGKKDKLHLVSEIFDIH